MLANLPPTPLAIGALSGDIPKPASFRLELVDFIARALPIWRDRPDRPNAASETALTSQVCAHLNSTARHAKGWDILQFRVEEADEHKAGRKIDLVASPIGTSITIEGRRHVDFDTIMPIECKRLPTPQGADRDDREYVISEKSSAGGIQRFKAGHHGAAHKLAAMIAYIEREKSEVWNNRVGTWIGALAGKEPGWTIGDALSLDRIDKSTRMAHLRSVHARQQGLTDIELRHLWIEMN